MNKILTVIGIAILLAVGCKAQAQTINGIGWEKIYPTESPFGYRKSGITDTVKAVVLISQCDLCSATAVSGFAVRSEIIYMGDRMPPGNYSNQWVVSEVLNSIKKQFPKEYIIWQYIIRP